MHYKLYSENFPTCVYASCFLRAALPLQHSSDVCIIFFSLDPWTLVPSDPLDPRTRGFAVLPARAQAHKPSRPYTGFCSQVAKGLKVDTEKCFCICRRHIRFVQPRRSGERDYGRKHFEYQYKDNDKYHQWVFIKGGVQSEVQWTGVSIM